MEAFICYSKEEKQPEDKDTGNVGDIPPDTGNFDPDRFIYCSNICDNLRCIMACMTG